MTHRTTGLTLAIVPVLAIAIVGARPNRYGHGDREERHMFPAVSSGPLDPAWSPECTRVSIGLSFPLGTH